MTTAGRKEYSISAGEFSRICGTTRDTLRYYEKHGVLIPWKDPENGYHYYSYAQIGSFYFISTLRSMHLSTKEIREYLSVRNSSDFLPYIHLQVDALRAQKRDLDRKIRQLSLVLELDSVTHLSDYGIPVISTFPDSIGFRMAPIASDDAYSLSDIARDIQEHIYLFPDMAASFPAGTAMDAAEFLRGDYRYNKVVSLYPIADADWSQDRLPDPGTIEAWESVQTFTLPTRTIAAIICRDSDGDIRQIYRALTDFIQKNHLEMLTDVFSISFINMMDPQQHRRYLKYVFVCVKG